MKSAVTITPPTAGLSNPRSVLLIDDNSNRRIVLSRLLGIANFEVSLAASSGEGLELARYGQFDLILINSRLAGHVATGLCRQIRDFNQRTPVLLYSAEPQNAEKGTERSLTLKREMGSLPAYI